MDPQNETAWSETRRALDARAESRKSVEQSLLGLVEDMDKKLQEHPEIVRALEERDGAFAAFQTALGEVTDVERPSSEQQDALYAAAKKLAQIELNIKEGVRNENDKLIWPTAPSLADPIAAALAEKIIELDTCRRDIQELEKEILSDKDQYLLEVDLEESSNPKLGGLNSKRKKIAKARKRKARSLLKSSSGKDGNTHEGLVASIKELVGDSDDISLDDLQAKLARLKEMNDKYTQVFSEAHDLKDRGAEHPFGDFFEKGIYLFPIVPGREDSVVNQLQSAGDDQAAVQALLGGTGEFFDRNNKTEITDSLPTGYEYGVDSSTIPTDSKQSFIDALQAASDRVHQCEQLLEEAAKKEGKKPPGTREELAELALEIALDKGDQGGETKSTVEIEYALAYRELLLARSAMKAKVQAALQAQEALFETAKGSKDLEGIKYIFEEQKHALVSNFEEEDFESSIATLNDKLAGLKPSPWGEDDLVDASPKVFMESFEGKRGISDTSTLLDNWRAHLGAMQEASQASHMSTASLLLRAGSYQSTDSFVSAGSVVDTTVVDPTKEYRVDASDAEAAMGDGDSSEETAETG